jgi:hypothetical protein
MRTAIRRHPLAALAALTLLAGVLLLSADARDGEELVVGWTVTQNGETVSYPFADQWRAELSQSGMVVANAKTGVRINFYGTFRVVHRPR